MMESASEPVMPFIYRILSGKGGRIVVAALLKQFIESVVVPLWNILPWPAWLQEQQLHLGNVVPVQKFQKIPDLPFAIGNVFEEKIIDLSSCEKIKIEKQSRSFAAGSVVELTEEARNIMTTNKYAQMIQQEIRKNSSWYQLKIIRRKNFWGLQKGIVKERVRNRNQQILTFVSQFVDFFKISTNFYFSTGQIRKCIVQ